MTLYLREADLERALQMAEVIAAVEAAFRAHGSGGATNLPRSRITAGGGTLHVMAAALPAQGVMGLKAYGSGRGGARSVGLLYSTETGALLAVMEANRLGQMRTGAASAVATKYLALPEAGTVGIIGTGWQALSQLRAISLVRPVALVKCYSRSADRREAFAEAMIRELGAEVAAVGSAREAVDGAEIVVTVTTAAEPVLRGAWLRPGMHINAAGANWAHRREVDTEAVARCRRIVVDDLAQARVECGDLIAPVADGVLDWEQVTELGAIVSGAAAGRSSRDEITLFESQGIALQDVAAMKLAYDRARALGLGEER